MRLLVVEDEQDLAGAVADHLRAVGHAVDSAGTLHDALAAVRATSYDLVLLDLHLPDGDGLSLVRDLRDRSVGTPVMIATARDRIMERIEGLEAGADDYLVKPYDLDEMVARIAAILRRADSSRAALRQFGSISVVPATKTVLRDGQPVGLTPKEWEILDRLSRRPGITVAKAEFEDALYGFGSEVESNAIEAHISRLRSKLGRGAIETVRGFGYRMGQG
ncbi:two component transcriptional regulator, winged helix family [Aliiroseovarius sediminilitoris]|uniref:Two component transcriptional regulator, winged helix family n=1 Tax=Aliiroseovarius sediminilitoris TaxID=1173584 RepID=A0A1I0QIS0_9RHOB|nr:response regulator transcription factor [Aliiroseovarius sediminilitoris]SEW26990.1 two component transcriptional regulator, winged helix family [Aliiroseovarius sediminilitoris]